jgi:hypothetical protein
MFQSFAGRAFGAAVALACCLALATPATAGPGEDYAREIAEAEELGLKLFRHDRAAWVATDAVAEKLDRNDQRAVKGWIEEPIGEDRYRVLFYGKGDQGTFPVASIETESGKAIKDAYRVFRPDELFEAGQYRAVKARERAIAEKVERCPGTYNTAVIPAPGKGYFVYLTLAMDDLRGVPLGGAYRVLVDGDGADVIGYKPFTKSCIVLKKPKGAVALLITQVLTDHPTEIHVWQSLLQEIDIFVMTKAGMWKVSEGRVSFEKAAQGAAQ